MWVSFVGVVVEVWGRAELWTKLVQNWVKIWVDQDPRNAIPTPIGPPCWKSREEENK